MDNIDETSNQNPDVEQIHPNSIRAFHTLGEFLEKDEWHPQRVSDDKFHGYWVHYNGSNAGIRCFVQIRTEHQILLIYAMAPVRIPEEKRHAIAEFITRANYGLNIGNFELNFDGGQLRYKSSFDFEDTDLTPDHIRNAIYPAVRTMNTYFPGVMMVLYNDATAEEAIARVES